MKISQALIAAASVALSTMLGVHPSRAAAAPPSSCGTLASQALAGVGDGLSTIWESDENRFVLKSALVSTAQLRACGDERDSISAELIVADAYGDVFPKRPGLRCAALRDAQKRLLSAGDARRARLVTTTLANCTNVRSDPSFAETSMRPSAARVAAYAGGAEAAQACSAGNALGAIADGLSSTAGTGSHPEDARTLAAALRTTAQLRACGNEFDSISAELIAADAYSDVYPHDPGKRCDALRDARRRLRALGDLKRAALVSRTLATGVSCRSK